MTVHKDVADKDVAHGNVADEDVAHRDAVHRDLVLKARVRLLSHNEWVLEAPEGLWVYRALFPASPRVYAYKLAYVLWTAAGSPRVAHGRCWRRRGPPARTSPTAPRPTRRGCGSTSRPRWRGWSSRRGVRGGRWSRGGCGTTIPI